MKSARQPPEPPVGARYSTVTRATRWGFVTQKAPRKRGAASSGYSYYKQREFALVAQIVKMQDPFAWATAKAWTDDTDMVPRDALTMAAMGTWIDIDDTEGNEWRGARMVSPNPQWTLDQVSSDLGSMLYRASIGWVAIPPGNAGQVLQMGAQSTPYWSGASGAAASPWRLLARSYYPENGSITSLTALDLQGCSDILMFVNNVVLNASQRIYARFSINGGVGWLSGSDTVEVSALGVATVPTLWDAYSTGSTGNRYGMVGLAGANISGIPKPIFSQNQNISGFIQTSWQPINAVQLIAAGGSASINGLWAILGR